METKPRILLVDDDANLTASLKRSFHKFPFIVDTSNDASEALKILEKEKIDVIVSDEKMPGISGTEFLSIACKKYPDTIRIMLTGYATIETALKAVNQGKIFHLFVKPCNFGELLLLIKRALQHKSLLSETRKLLATSRHQTKIIKKLKHENSDLLKVNRDEDGSVILGEVPQTDEEFDKLIEKVKNHTSRDNDSSS